MLSLHCMSTHSPPADWRFTGLTLDSHWRKIRLTLDLQRRYIGGTTDLQRTYNGGATTIKKRFIRIFFVILFCYSTYFRIFAAN